MIDSITEPISAADTDIRRAQRFADLLRGTRASVSRFRTAPSALGRVPDDPGTSARTRVANADTGLLVGDLESVTGSRVSGVRAGGWGGAPQSVRVGPSGLGVVLVAGHVGGGGGVSVVRA